LQRGQSQRTESHPAIYLFVDALARRDQVRIVVDGITAANDLGLTDAVPQHAVVLTDARLKPIQLGNLTIKIERRAWRDVPTSAGGLGAAC
jgi:hypothetical protein